MALAELAEKYVIDEQIKMYGETFDTVWENIKAKRQENGMTGIPSKFEILNKYFTYENGELILIGGRAKSGKSIFFMNEIKHKMENGVPCAIFDTEMSTERWTERFLAHLLNVEVRDLKTGKYDNLVEEKRDWIKKQKFTHIYDPDWTKDKIYTTAKILKLKMDLSFLVYDYVKVNDSSSLQQSEANVLGDMTNFLKNKVGGSLNIPVLAGGQMSPYDTRLADSDKLNRYASVIAYWIHKTKEEMVEDGAEQGNVKMIIDYNRLGEQMGKDSGEYLNFVFDGNKATISQAKVAKKEEKLPDFLK
jgi:replicative DNA helicase